jgi:hypothetical protein
MIFIHNKCIMHIAVLIFMHKNQQMYIRVRPYRQSSGQAAGLCCRGGEVMVAASYLGGGNMYFKDIPACLVTVYISRQINNHQERQLGNLA